MRRQVSLLLLALHACTSSKTKLPIKCQGTLMVTADVPTAIFELDDEPIGEIGLLTRGLLVACGEHQIAIRSERHFPFEDVVSVSQNQSRRVSVKLISFLPR